MRDPVPVPRADYLVVESTYGNRRHEARDPEEALAEIVDEDGGAGRYRRHSGLRRRPRQSLMFHLERLKSKGRLANIPVFLDSPMAM